ncbi:hypothetical protein OSTOST_17825 [Ostertagia ostertagi]
MIDTTTVLKETNLNDTDRGIFELSANCDENSVSVIHVSSILHRKCCHYQEDLELMIKELDRWLNDAKKCESSLKAKDAQGIGDSHKLSTVLESLDEDVKNMRSMVNASKARIATNNRRIQEILSNI